MSDERKLADAIVRVERWTRIGGDSLAVDDDIRALIVAARASLVPRENNGPAVCAVQPTSREDSGGSADSGTAPAVPREGDALALAFADMFGGNLDGRMVSYSAEEVRAFAVQQRRAIFDALRSADAAPPPSPNRGAPHRLRRGDVQV